MVDMEPKSVEVSEPSLPAEESPAGEAVSPTAAPSGAAAEAPAVSAAAPAPSGPMRWCVLRVASNKEEQVRDALQRKVKIEGLEGRIGRILVPMEKRPAPRSRGGARKTVDRKMYPGYVFLEMRLEENGSIDERAWFTIKETTGVGDFIGSAGKPTPMSQADVEKMLLQVEKAQDGGPVSVEFAKNDQVKIKEGAFENFEGTVDEVLADKGLVRVIVTIFGRATPIELEYWQIEKV